jgi:Flp pilus assembly protein TadD
VNLGVAYANRGDFEQAAIALETAATLDPDNGLTHYNLGVVYVYQGDNERARQSFERVLALSSSDELAEQARQQLEQLRH